MERKTNMHTISDDRLFSQKRGEKILGTKNVYIFWNFGYALAQSVA